MLIIYLLNLQKAEVRGGGGGGDSAYETGGDACRLA